MSLPTEQPYAEYLTVLAIAYDALRHVDTQTGQLLRDWIEAARTEITTGQLTNQTDTILEIARDINRGTVPA